MIVVNPRDNSLMMTATCVGKMLQGDGKGNRVEIVNFSIDETLDPCSAFSLPLPEGASEVFKLLEEYNIFLTPRN